MLTTEFHGSAAAQPGEERDIEGEPLSDAERPPRLEFGELVFGPCLEADLVVFAGEQSHALGVRRSRPAFPPLADCRRVYVNERFVAGAYIDGFEDILWLASGRRR